MPSAKRMTQEEKKAKADAENARFEAALDAQVDAGRVMGNMTCQRSFADKCGNVMTFYILEEVDRMQKELKNDSNGVDSFPPDRFVLLAEKKAGGGSSSSKRKPKTTKSSKPKKRVIAKKGVSSANVTTTHEESDDESSSEEKKTVVKKSNVAQVQRSAKTYLSFIASRFFYEVYNVDGGKIADTPADFAQLMYSQLDESIDTQISRVIIPAVERYGSTVCNTNSYDFGNKVVLALDGLLVDYPALQNQMVRYLVAYFKLLGKYMAHMLWVKHSSVTPALVESAMRLLNIGAREHMVDKGVCDEDESDMGLYTGVLSYMKEYDNALNPPLSQEEKDARAAKRKAAKESKKNMSETKSTPEQPADNEDSDNDSEIKTVSDEEKDSSDNGSDSDNSGSDSDEEPPAKTRPLKKNKTKRLRTLKGRGKKK